MKLLGVRCVLGRGDLPAQVSSQVLQERSAKFGAGGGGGGGA